MIRDNSLGSCKNGLRRPIVLGQKGCLKRTRAEAIQAAYDRDENDEVL